MKIGTVKWFDPVRGIGWIKPREIRVPDIFVHINQVKDSGLDTLMSGQAVDYEEETNRFQNRMKLHAINIRLR